MIDGQKGDCELMVLVQMDIDGKLDPSQTVDEINKYLDIEHYLKSHA